MELKLGINWRPKVGVKLLIVPYGIETSIQLPQTTQALLLIVPYGIETMINFCFIAFLFSFNRTLWN